METFTFTLPSLEKEITVHKKSKFHLFGDPENPFKYHSYIDEMMDLNHKKKYGDKKDCSIKEYECDDCGCDDGDCDNCFYCHCKKCIYRDISFEEEYDLYKSIVMEKIKKDENVLPGDIVYIVANTMNTRQWHGLHIILVDNEGEKIICNYGDGLKLYKSMCKINKELFNKLINFNRMYFTNADYDSMYLLVDSDSAEFVFDKRGMVNLMIYPILEDSY
jgi:hypothetical protein